MGRDVMLDPGDKSCSLWILGGMNLIIICKVDHK